QAVHSLLNHGLGAVERQHLLGAALAAQRPESCAAPAGQNHGIEAWFRCHCLPAQRFPRGTWWDAPELRLPARTWRAPAGEAVALSGSLRWRQEQRPPARA